MVMFLEGDLELPIAHPSRISKRDGGLRKDIEELRQGVERGDGKASMDKLNRKFARLRNLRMKD